MSFNKHILTKSGAIRPEQEIFGMHKSGETRPTAHTTLHYMYSIDYYSFGMKVSAHGDTETAPSAGDAQGGARPNRLSKLFGIYCVD